MYYNMDMKERKMKIKIKQIDGGKLPAYKRDGDVCMDCYAREFNIVPAFGRKLIPLGFALELPVGYEAIIRPRSGLSKMGIDETIGTIDTNYRGEVMACVCNTLDEDFIIEEGDRICQLAIREAPTIAWEVVKKLSETERGDSGFGSSGMK